VELLVGFTQFTVTGVSSTTGDVGVGEIEVYGHVV
jgi:hypothetical protein